MIARYSIKNSSGFTLVEMLLVVTVLGVLSGVLISTINQQMQRKRAEDAVNRSKMEQVSQGIESYMATEGTYPPAQNGLPVATSMGEYIATWPASMVYVVSANYDNFAVYVLASNDSYLKYSSTWGSIKNCSPADITEVGECTEYD